MRERSLGSSGLAVGAVGLGCMGMTWGYTTGGAPAEESVGTIHRALELGVDLLDTADMYGPFTNEELVGSALAGRRDEAVLATKVGNVVQGDGSIGRDGRPEHVRRAIDASLARLGTDHVDLYQLHRVDPSVPLAETWGALAEVVSAGKARFIGLSEVDVEQLDIAQRIHPVTSVQSELSLWTRDALENGVVAWCADHGAAFVPFAPLGRGYLTGKLGASSFERTDFRSRNPRFTREAMEANRRIVEAVEEVASRAGATASQVAIAWTLAQGSHVVPIPGTKRVAYLEENAAAAEVELSGSDLADLDGLPAALGSRY